MADLSPTENEFLSQVTAHIEQNITNEQFGVSDLADKMNMSRSNLLRKVKKLTNLSVSQLINQVRLTQAMTLLRTSSLNVSEVSHHVGFSSTSYFIKCFREHYGYPPGEVGKRDEAELNAVPDVEPERKRTRFIPVGVALAVVLGVGLFAFYSWPSSPSPSPEKSIAVLPFKNESNDSTNVYLINGLMEATLNNLQQLKELKVTSRTSAEKYRNTSKSIPEMATELNVSYFVEGSGQKIGDGILLNIQLIEAATDKHLWAKQYRRETKDIFELQQEIAKNIAAEIQVIITPEEEKRIEKNPTDNPVAYDFFLKGKDLFYKSDRESLEKAIPYFKKAIEHDNKFALAYANAVMVYYYLDMFNTAKKYSVEINSYADKALLLDSELPESLIAKGLDYADKKEYQQAVPYLEKALAYNPNSGLVIHFLTEFYSIHIPNTAKYLEVALKGVRLEGPSTDSATLSFKYFHLGSALFQAGFTDEALTYTNKADAYNSKNPFSIYVRASIAHARNKDLKQTKDIFLNALKKNPMRFDFLQEVGKTCYLMRDYNEAYTHYKKFIELREIMQLDIFKHENLKIAIVLEKAGLNKKSQELVKSFKDFSDNDRSIYKHRNLAMYYAYQGNMQKAIEHLQLFSKEDNCEYWVILTDNDPAFDSIKDLPQYKTIMRNIETRFWKVHREIEATLDKNELL
jgi:TolB-like protein/AraC-like DNA-binding protein/Tfp pilus assembly protein PilF